MISDDNYNRYLNNHISNVNKAYNWIKINLPDILDCLTDFEKRMLENNIKNHDISKYSKEEYDAYNDYFYGDRNDEVVEQFNYAWNHHQKCNPHHWQYWILIKDDLGVSIPLDIPYLYIIEMICDWWSFSWSKDNLFEIFSWYSDNIKYIRFSIYTENTVNHILNLIHDRLLELGELDK